MTEAERRRQARRSAAGKNLRILGEPTKDLKANDTRRIRGKTQFYNPETKKFQNRRYVAKAPGEVTESQKREQENEAKRAAANKAREEGKLSNIPPNRDQLAIEQDDTFSGFDAMRNPERLDASTFAPPPMTTKEMLSEIDTLTAEPESLDDVLEKSLTGTTEVVNDARNSTMQDQLRETTGRLNQLKILQDAGVPTGPQGMVKIDGKGFASVKTAAGNKALKKQLARLKAQQLAKIRIGG
tara:strand:- start:647 stop:1369 length:723 start_codon:yes stop_codon:yes gene_type:complete